MSKVYTAFRINAEDRTGLQEWADREGISLSKLLTILTTHTGPEALVKRITTQHAVNELARLNMPEDSAITVDQNPELFYPLIALMKVTAELVMARCLGNIDEADELEGLRGRLEAQLFSAFALNQKDLTTTK